MHLGNEKCDGYGREYSKEIEIDKPLEIVGVKSIERDAFDGLKESFRMEEATGPNSDVDYSADSLDCAFIKSITMFKIDKDIFELVIDRLEKEWFSLVREIIKKRWKEMESPSDSVCDVCTYSEVEDDNCIIFCDGCNICVHQKCYGVPVIPNGMWFCKKCVFFGCGFPKCIMCGKVGGAYKQTVKKEWCHVCCAMFVPWLCFLNVTFLEPIDYLEKNGTDKCNGVCVECNESCGAVISCDYMGCKRKYHVTCGIECGSYFDMANSVSYCTQHDPRVDGRLWSIEDFYSVRSILYKKLRHRPRIMNNVKLRIPDESLVIVLRSLSPIVCKSFFDKILDIDMASIEDEGIRKSMLKVIAKYWMTKRWHKKGPLISFLDPLYGNSEIEDWCKMRFIKTRGNLEKVNE